MSNGSHTSEKRWRDKMFETPQGRQGIGVSGEVSSVCKGLRDSLIEAEEAYQQLQELYAYVGSTAQLLADQLFAEDIEARGDSVANAEELAKTQDAIDAITAGHEIYQAANNVAVAQSDRLSELRRMI